MKHLTKHPKFVQYFPNKNNIHIYNNKIEEKLSTMRHIILFISILRHISTIEGVSSFFFFFQFVVFFPSFFFGVSGSRINWIFWLFIGHFYLFLGPYFDICGPFVFRVRCVIFSWSTPSPSIVPDCVSCNVFSFT